MSSKKASVVLGTSRCERLRPLLVELQSCDHLSACITISITSTHTHTHIDTHTHTHSLEVSTSFFSPALLFSLSSLAFSCSVSLDGAFGVSAVFLFFRNTIFLPEGETGGSRDFLAVLDYDAAPYDFLLSVSDRESFSPLAFRRASEAVV